MGGEGYSLAHQLADVRPNIMSTTLQIDGNPPINPRFYAIARPEFAGPALDFELSRGAVLVKVYSWLHKPEFDAIVKAAHQRHISVVGHLPEALTPEQALAGVNVVAHAEEYLKYLEQPLKQVRIDYLAELTRKNEDSVVPNLVAYAAIARHARNPELELGKPEFAYLMPYVFQEWLPRHNRYFNREKPAAFVARIDAGLKTMKRLVLTLHRAAVPLFSGTDASIFCYPGLCLLEELDLLHEAGLTRYETLQCATANPGRFVQDKMHRPERFGTITRGSRADLLLLSDNPLESFDPLQSPLGVMVAGRWLSADELEHRRDAMKPDLERRRALVMEYERLEASTNHTLLRAFLSGLDPNDRLFGENVVLQDAAALRRTERPADALGLLNEMTRLMPESHALWNAIGSLKQAAGDLAGARTAYEQSLALRPVNGVAVTALEELRAATSSTSN